MRKLRRILIAALLRLEKNEVEETEDVGDFGVREWVMAKAMEQEDGKGKEEKGKWATRTS
jgi:hypothetical protein